MKFTIFTLSSFAILCLTQAQNTYRPQYPSRNVNAANAYSADTRASYDDNSNSRYVTSQPAYRPQSAPASGSVGYGPAPRTYRKPTADTAVVSNAGSRATSAATAEDADAAAEAEEEQKPGRLEILLQQSKFTCANKKDGYYADGTVNCEVFHYCVAGAKHSWMCPENTVFHQVHLNCVPAAQDICGETDKYSAQVNDYLHKPLDQRGPNNTVLYHQRYYPEEFIGDALTANAPGIQHFGYAPGTAPQAAAQPVARPQAQPQPARPVASRPTYTTYDNSNDEDDQPAYRPSVPSRPPTRSQPSYSPYQNVPVAPKPIVPAAQPAYKPVNKPIAIAPAPQPYLANYRPVSTSQPRRPDYSSYQPTSAGGYTATSKPPSFASYSNNYPSSASSANRPSGYSVSANVPSYKPSNINAYTSARAQSYKPSGASVGAASYPVSYSPSVYDSEASSSSSSSSSPSSPTRAINTYEEEY